MDRQLGPSPITVARACGRDVGRRKYDSRRSGRQRRGRRRSRRSGRLDLGVRRGNASKECGCEGADCSETRYERWQIIGLKDRCLIGLYETVYTLREVRLKRIGAGTCNQVAEAAGIKEDVRVVLEEVGRTTTAANIWVDRSTDLARLGCLWEVRVWRLSSILD